MQILLLCINIFFTAYYRVTVPDSIVFIQSGSLVGDISRRTQTAPLASISNRPALGVYALIVQDLFMCINDIRHPVPKLSTDLGLIHKQSFAVPGTTVLP